MILKTNSVRETCTVPNSNFYVVQNIISLKEIGGLSVPGTSDKTDGVVDRVMYRFIHDVFIKIQLFT